MIDATRAMTAGSGRCGDPGEPSVFRAVVMTAGGLAIICVNLCMLVLAGWSIVEMLRAMAGAS